eukprot:6582900-Prymnesium_polylepis.1
MNATITCSPPALQLGASPQGPCSSCCARSPVSSASPLAPLGRRSPDVHTLLEHAATVGAAR